MDGKHRHLQNTREIKCNSVAKFDRMREIKSKSNLTNKTGGWTGHMMRENQEKWNEIIKK